MLSMVGLQVNPIAQKVPPLLQLKHKTNRASGQAHRRVGHGTKLQFHHVQQGET